MIGYCPEPPLEPPEDVIAGTCTVCGGEIYDGDNVWWKDGDMVHMRHMDSYMADTLDFVRIEVWA